MTKNKWFDSAIVKPPQGLKVLCCNNGAFSVRQRYGDYWFSIPYYDSRFSTYEPPQLWQYIEFPDPFTGYIRIKIGDEILTPDEYEIKYKDHFDFFVNAQKKLFDSEKKNEKTNKDC